MPSTPVKNNYKHKRSLFMQSIILVVATGSIISLIFPSFSFAQNPPQTPETFEEAGDLAYKIIRPIPEGIKKAWEGVLKIWQKMADFIYNLWSLKVNPFFQDIWQSILTFFGKEIEKKEEQIKEEIEKEKEEIRKEIIEVEKSIWQKIKDWAKGFLD